MSLKDAIADDLLTVFLNEDDWAESCAYLPAGVDGCEAVTLTALIRTANGREDGELIDADYERIQVLICRDPDSAKGGVATPAIGDQLTRTSIDSEPYQFLSLESTQDPSCWRLLFQRRTHRMAGPGGQR